MSEATCWQPEIERMDREALAQLQLERLEATLTRVYRTLPFYRRRLDEAGVDPDGVRSPADLRRIPFTTKEDLRQSYPYGLFAVPLRDVVRLHASSGTTGLSTVVGYTRNDLAAWSNAVARVMVAGGVTKDDVVQVAFHYGLFTGGFGLHQGAELLGASVIPMSSGHSRQQLRIMQDYRTTALVCTPSYALHLAEELTEQRVARGALSLRVGLFGGEPWSEAMRRQLEEQLQITATDNYGLSELMGPGVAGECQAKQGLHLAEDHFLAELVHPETGAPAREGEVGELVLTTLTKEAFPLLRYRTGDLTTLTAAPCPCGRTLARMGRVLGRTDDQLIIKGVKVYPSQIEAVLVTLPGADPHYQIVLTRRAAIDEATVLVEVSEAIFFDEMRRQSGLRETITRRLADELGVSVAVKLVERKSLARSEGKATRVVDQRGGSSGLAAPGDVV
ncbi:MAG: phenylacetate--CoA ligase [Anaeromyxobacter sp.]|nr:phenylacetate--CoA ligase [Anaeromyxobacter sp.]MBL0278270.1 phenylacetate--CoA ligase [Anaeromyxobacter sp.]